jgi:hypothetical protein
MGFYRSTFTIALLLMALAIACAFIPEIREFLRRFRRTRHERHIIRREEEDGTPRRKRPKLTREDRDQG